MAFPILKQTQQSLGFFDSNNGGGDDGLSSLTNLVDVSSVTNKSNILETRQALSSLLHIPVLTDTLDIIHDSIEIATFDAEAYEPIPIGDGVISSRNVRNPDTNITETKIEPILRPLPDHPRLPDMKDFMKFAPTSVTLSSALEPDGDCSKRMWSDFAADGEEPFDYVESQSPKKSKVEMKETESPEAIVARIPDQQVSTPRYQYQKQEQPRFRGYQKEQWDERFEELCEFHKKNGHCQVQNTQTESRPLARWVKRQRYQYRLRMEGKPSAMTNERAKALEDLGFIWDSHSAAWDERLKELVEFKNTHRHCNVPSNYTANPSLASWVKSQRRQYKLFREGQPSTMTINRIIELEKISFEWEIRSKSQKRSWCNGY